MNQNNFVQVNMAIPEHYRNLLRKMAAKRNLENPNRVASGTSIAIEILTEHLDRIENMEDKKSRQVETAKAKKREMSSMRDQDNGEF
jgi:hypothetical protein